MGTHPVFSFFYSRCFSSFKVGYVRWNQELFRRKKGYRRMWPVAHLGRSRDIYELRKFANYTNLVVRVQMKKALHRMYHDSSPSKYHQWLAWAVASRLVSFRVNICSLHNNRTILDNLRVLIMSLSEMLNNFRSLCLLWNALWCRRCFLILATLLF